MPNLQARVPDHTYREVTDYMEKNGISERSKAVRELIAKALFEDKLLEQFRAEQERTRMEMRRHVYLIVSNLGKEKPVSAKTVKKAIEEIAQKTEG